MEKCTKCKTVELSDYEEFKYHLCWSCMSCDMDIIDKNPDIAEIKEAELLAKEKDSLSIVIKDLNGTTLKMAASKKNNKKGTNKHPLSDVLDGDGNEEDLTKPTKGKNLKEEPIVPIEEPPVPPSPKEDTDVPPKPDTTAPKNGKEKKLIEDDDELKVVRESKEILTKADRAKMRAYALINRALKETGQFELSVILNDTHETVSSAPL